MEYKTVFLYGYDNDDEKVVMIIKREIYFKKQVFKGRNWDTYECGKE